MRFSFVSLNISQNIFTSIEKNPQETCRLSRPTESQIQEMLVAVKMDKQDAEDKWSKISENRSVIRSHSHFCGVIVVMRKCAKNILWINYDRKPQGITISILINNYLISVDCENDMIKYCTRHVLVVGHRRYVKWWRDPNSDKISMHSFKSLTEKPDS